MYLGTGKVLALVGTPADVADALRQLYGQDAGEPSCNEVPCRSDELHVWFHDDHRTVATDMMMPCESPPPSTPCRGAWVAGDALLETPPKQWDSMQVKAHPGLPPEWPAEKAAL